MKALKVLALGLALLASPSVFACTQNKAAPSSATKEEKKDSLFSRVNETYKKSQTQLRPQG